MENIKNNENMDVANIENNNESLDDLYNNQNENSLDENFQLESYSDFKELDVEEFRRKRKKRRKKHPFLKFFIFLFIIIGIITYFLGEKFDISKVEVEGSRIYSKSQLVKIGKIPLGNNIFLSKLSRVESNLEKDSHIKYAKVKREFPNKIKITIVERNPIATIKYNKYFVIFDKNKMVIDILKKPPSVTRVYGLKASKVYRGEKLLVDNNEALEESIKILVATKKNDLRILSTKINSENTALLRVKKNIAIIGNEKILIKQIENGNLKQILRDLKRRSIERGRITFTNNEYCVFSPKIL